MPLETWNRLEEAPESKPWFLQIKAIDPLNTFQLIPFPHSVHPPVQVTATVELKNQLLRIKYQIQGPGLASILIPYPEPKASSPSRKDLLWQHTCFELFLTKRDDPSYYELNLSPSGDWNFYRFSGYRSDQKTEALIQTAPLTRSEMKSKEEYRLDAAIDLSPLLSAQHSELLLGVTTVLETKDAKKSYWALTHCGEQPDFHRRESFKPLT